MQTGFKAHHQAKLDVQKADDQTKVVCLLSPNGDLDSSSMLLIGQENGVAFTRGSGCKPHWKANEQ
eukprot:3842495-Amphidinium_carterae.1